MLFRSHFSASKRRRVSMTTLFGVRQKQSESLREYLARFNEETLKVSHPNQELFVGAFQNGLRAGQFNESLAQKPATDMDEITSRAECYIKGEESNQEKRLRDGTGNTRSREEAPSRKREHPRTNARERHAPRPYRPSSYPDEYLTPLNKRREDILKEVAYMNLIREPHRP